MKIICDENILNDETEKEHFISCMSAHRECHTLDLSNVPDLLNYSSADRVFAEKIKYLAKISANKKYFFRLGVLSKASSQNHTAKNNTVVIDLLNRVLSKKATVILENEHSDLKFLKTVLISSNKKNILKELNVSWEVRGAGGCGDIPKLIRSEVQRSLGINRIFVLHDSDKLHCANAPSQIQQNIISVSTSLQVFCHTLQKREIENYIPDELIEQLDHARKEMIYYFRRLTSEQKDYFDYKYGFKKKNGYKKINDPAFNNLYVNLDDQTFNALKNGFGKTIGDTVFDNEDAFTFDDFTRRCGKISAEFNEISDVIQRIL